MCRIYRPIQKVDEAKSLRAVDYTETTGDDVPCRLMPVDEATEFVAQNLTVQVANLRVPRGTDIDKGYAVITWKLRTAAGVREKVVAQLAAAVSIGDTSLSVTTTLGIEPGDNCVVADTHVFRVASVADAVLGMYADQTPTVEWDDEDVDAGVDVEVKDLWIVEPVVRPQAVRGPLMVRVRQQPGWWPS